MRFFLRVKEGDIVNPFMAYEAIETKIKAKESLILDPDKFSKLLACDSMEKIGNVLKTEYRFDDQTDAIKKRSLHRDLLEVMFNRYRVTELEDILHFFSGPYKAFLQTFFMEFEIYDLLLILRKIAKEESTEGVQDHFIHSQNYTSLPYDKLLEVKTVGQFIEKLKGTVYYDVFKTAKDSDFAGSEFHAETKLHLLLYNTLFLKAQKLSPIDKAAAEDLLGLKIDCLNVQWIYRAKKYYHISPEQMLIHSLRGGRKLSFNRLKAMCYSNSADEIPIMANDYLRYKIFSDGSEWDMEKNINLYLYENATDRRHKETIGIAISYIYFLEIMMNEFVVATESIKYRVPKETMEKYLLHRVRKGGLKQ